MANLVQVILQIAQAFLQFSYPGTAAAKTGIGGHRSYACINVRWSGFSLGSEW